MKKNAFLLFLTVLFTFSGCKSTPYTPLPAGLKQIDSLSNHYISVKKSNESECLFAYFLFEGKPLSIDELLKVLVRRDVDAQAFIMNFNGWIHKAATVFHWDRYGFTLEGLEDSTILAFMMQGLPKTADQDFYLSTAPYNPETAFKVYINGGGGKKRISENEVAIEIESHHIPPNALVIPKGPYPTIFHFSKNASSKEILGLWSLVAQVASKAKKEEKFKRLAINTGSPKQTVFHCHVRIEKTA